MKKALLATTAIAGVALALQPAQAQETKFSIDGSAELGINYSSATILKNGNRKGNGTFDTKVIDDAFSLSAGTPEIHVNASREVAPGITTGMQIEFDTGKPDFNESEVEDKKGIAFLDEFSGYIEGNFGKVEMGYQDGAADQLGVGGYAGGGDDVLDGDAKKFQSKWVSIADDGTETKQEFSTVETGVGQHFDSDDSLKLSYYSPDFAGFKLGLSYAYRGYKLVVTEKTATGDDPVKTEKTLHHGIETGAAYAGDFGSAGSIKAGIGFSVDLDPDKVEKDKKPTKDAQTNMGIRVGAIYSIAGADIGLGLSSAILADKTKATPIHIQASAKYTLSNIPLDFGVGFGYGLGLGTVKNDNKPKLAASAWAVGGAVGYNIFDGVRVSADVIYSATSVEEYYDDTSTNTKKTATHDTGEVGVLAQLALSF